jgi:hypothetical protein
MGEASRSAAPGIRADYAQPACERKGLNIVEYKLKQITAAGMASDQAAPTLKCLGSCRSTIELRPQTIDYVL